MNKRKQIRKSVLIAIGMCMIVFLGACGGSIKQQFGWEAKKELKKVQQLEDEVNFCKRENMKIQSASVTQKGLYVHYIVKEEGLFENFGEMTHKSNEFLKEHPDYLSQNDDYIWIYCEGTEVEEPEYIISNKMIEGYFDKGEIEFAVEDTTDLQYFYMQCDDSLPQVQIDASRKLEISVLLIDWWRNDINQESLDLKFFENFVGLKYIVINVDYPKADNYSILKERIEEQVPDCEVYIIHEGESLVKNADIAGEGRGK